MRQEQPHQQQTQGRQGQVGQEHSEEERMRIGAIRQEQIRLEAIRRAQIGSAQGTRKIKQNEDGKLLEVIEIRTPIPSRWPGYRPRTPRSKLQSYCRRGRSPLRFRRRSQEPAE